MTVAIARTVDLVKTHVSHALLVSDDKGSCWWLQPDFHGMLPVVSGQFASLQTGAINWSNKLRQAVAVCNALTTMGRGRVAGDPAEKALFKKVEAQFLVSKCVRLNSGFVSSLTAKASSSRPAFQANEVGLCV